MSDERYAGVEAGLRARINALVDETLANAKPGMSLTEIEDIALKVREQVGEAVTQALASEQAPVAVPGPVCEQCGREMHAKG